jgi:hypothetical protein
MSYIRRNTMITGMVQRKCKHSIMTLLKGITDLGKTVFFIICALAMNENSELEVVLANHCQGNNPVIIKIV